MQEILTESLIDLSARLRRRDVSARELMDAVLERIDATNDRLLAFVALRDREALLADARAADDRIARGEARALEGIPLGVKDLEHVAGLPNTEGSRLFEGRVSDHTEVHVARLEAAGAIVVGKTNAPEFGWTMAKALLGHERTLIGGVAQSGKWIQVVKRLARDTPVGDGNLLEDPAFRRRIAKLEMRHRAVNMVNLRTLAAAQLGQAPGAESSILKIVGTELYQEVTELTMDAMGHDALGWFDSPEDALPAAEKYVASQFNYLRACTIYGGSNEIQKNIVSKHILRLPTN